MCFYGVGDVQPSLETHSMDQLEEVWIGGALTAKDIILQLAAMLRSDAAPGMVTLVLLASALVVSIWIWLLRRRRVAAVKWAITTISRAEGREGFARKFQEIHAVFLNVRDGRRPLGGKINKPNPKAPKTRIATTWGEYHETMMVPSGEGSGVYRNVVRPSAFFDAEELGFELGTLKIVPGLFVSVGLVLTFLGLISALTAIGGGEITDDSLRDLLNAASAKFIMSLTGLFCSIVLTIQVRFSSNQIDDAIREFCHALESRLLFESVDKISLRQLEATKEQNTILQSMATEMVAELARPLKEELPSTIGSAIKDNLAPLLEKIGQTSEQGLGQMVGDLSTKLTGDVEQALSVASQKLTAGSDQLAAVLNTMQSNTSQMGADMRLALQEASHEMVDSSKQISKPLENLLEQLIQVAETTRQSASSLKGFADAAKAGGETISNSSRAFETAATAFSRASQPLTQSVEQLEKSSREMSQGLEKALTEVREQTHDTSVKTRDALDAAREILGAQHRGISDAMSGLAVALNELENQGERMDTIDAKLGSAFEAYRDQVNATMEDSASKVREIVEILNPALDTMKTVVERAEEYIPSSRA